MAIRLIATPSRPYLEFIRLTLSSVVAAKLDLISETLPRIGHLLMGAVALVYAMGTLVNEFTHSYPVPLGKDPFANDHRVA